MISIGKSHTIREIIVLAIVKILLCYVVMDSLLTFSSLCLPVATLLSTSPKIWTQMLEACLDLFNHKNV